MEDMLKQTGLNDIQARTYLYLLKHGPSVPPQIAKDLDLTRSNAYKVLDSLVAISLVGRSEVQNKFTFSAEDPNALIELVSAEKNRVTALEKDIKHTAHELRQTYKASSASEAVVTASGSKAVAALHKGHAAQAGLTSKKAIKGRLSVVGMKAAGSKHLQQAAGYDQAIEWAVTADGLLITNFGADGSAVLIKDEAVARAFAEILGLLK